MPGSELMRGRGRGPACLQNLKAALLDVARGGRLRSTEDEWGFDEMRGEILAGNGVRLGSHDPAFPPSPKIAGFSPREVFERLDEHGIEPSPDGPGEPTG